MVARTEREELLSYISDAHKDAYGTRPHGRYNNLTLAELRQVADELSDAVGEAIKREADEKAATAIAFEVRVTEVIASGAGDRKTALRWIFDAEDISVTVSLYGGSYAAYHFGLELRYFTKEYPDFPAILMGE